MALVKGVTCTPGAGSGANQVDPQAGCCLKTSLLIGSVGRASNGLRKRATSGPIQAALEAEEEKNRTPRINRCEGAELLAIQWVKNGATIHSKTI